MRALIQEACQGAVRDVVAGQAARLASLSEEDLRPVNLRDFQARPHARMASSACVSAQVPDLAKDDPHGSGQESMPDSAATHATAKRSA